MPAKPNPRRANGHRRNQVRARVLREESDCWLCGQPVDKTLGMIPGKHSARCVADGIRPGCTGCVPHPGSPEIDEIVPVTLGGSPIDRANCRLSHRLCNVRRGNGTRGNKPTKGMSSTRTWAPGGGAPEAPV